MEEGSKLNSNARVCDLCLDAATEELLAAADERELLCIMFGSEIGDHLCEEIETDGVTRCSCSCHEPEKQALRSQAKASAL